ncbi:MAG: 2'-5' RNA ligase [Myxococcota bacterium]|jgi:2'-5' RNA ligase
MIRKRVTIAVYEAWKVHASGALEVNRYTRGAIASGELVSQKNKTASQTNSAVKRRKRAVITSTSEPVRAFCALTLDDAATQSLDKAIHAERRRMDSFNWVEPEKWHVTLKFFREVPRDRLEDLARGLKAVAGQPIATSIRGVGGVPDLRAPRSLWVGIDDPNNALIKLYRRVNAISAELGFEPEDRRFKPHITIARPKKGRTHPVARELTPLMGQNIADTVLRELVLMTSEFHPDGPVFTPVMRTTLGGGATF